MVWEIEFRLKGGDLCSEVFRCEKLAWDCYFELLGDDDVLEETITEPYIIDNYSDYD